MTRQRTPENITGTSSPPLKAGEGGKREERGLHQQAGPLRVNILNSTADDIEVRATADSQGRIHLNLTVCESRWYRNWKLAFGALLVAVLFAIVGWTLFLAEVLR